MVLGAGDKAECAARHLHEPPCHWPRPDHRQTCRAGPPRSAQPSNWFVDKHQVGLPEIAGANRLIGVELAARRKRLRISCFVVLAMLPVLSFAETRIGVASSIKPNADGVMARTRRPPAGKW